ncbi:shikimate dehydrogenase [Parasphingorhabdus marina DSM 22363]|uniref:Shikimate dehydrogenase (NADP(+)) n=1 Tax=Parasphingorhabdus marina DSM 22363 TaxID=1123272 RepID=A0A1N6CNP7_9SPHN|nr:shikimate dehydrogenase [Parasphingorhabdus marina]SIN60208.1 shikimate dehydrogenase [Parasphingorhabdus marina DSM 22363]
MSKIMPYAEVIGDPIAQSKSPIIHKFWLEKLGISADYRACHVKPEDLEDYLADRRKDDAWQGCNVTLPHKLAVMDHVEDPGGLKQSIGAMNTIARTPDGALFGTNTDAGGFFAPIADFPLKGKDVVVIGAGGAARAVLFALSKAEAGTVTIVNRNVLKASSLLMHFGLKGRAIGHGEPLPSAALLVNSSSLGMAGQEPLAIDLASLPEDALVYDLVYAPLETGLLKTARARGLETMDGLSMLIGQAALAFEIFFDAVPPLEHDEELRKLLLA